MVQLAGIDKADDRPPYRQIAARAKGHTKRVRRQRVDQATGRVTTRTTTVRKRLFAGNRGFVTVNDAPAMASQLARYLALANCQVYSLSS